MTSRPRRVMAGSGLWRWLLASVTMHGDTAGVLQGSGLHDVTRRHRRLWLTAWPDDDDGCLIGCRQGRTPSGQGSQDRKQNKGKPMMVDCHCCGLYWMRMGGGALLFGVAPAGAWGRAAHMARAGARAACATMAVHGRTGVRMDCLSCADLKSESHILEASASAACGWVKSS
jgi:hypothetical protein